MKIFWIIIITSMANSCNTSNLEDDVCKDIREILIVNRGANKYLEDSTLLADKNSILEFCELHRNMESYGNNPNVKSNFGFFEIIITTNGDKKMNMGVIYTVYEGVVIRDFNGGFYKQDKYDDFIIRKSNKRE